MSTGALKPLRRPHLWLGLWLLAVAVVCVASLTPPPPMELPRHGDKVEHLLAYAALAAAAVQVFRPGRALWAAGIGLVLMGVSPFVQELMIGLVIIVAVGIDKWSMRRRS